MFLLIISLISYSVFALISLIALIVLIKNGRKASFREVLMVLAWPVTIVRGLLGVFDDKVLNGIEIVAILNTLVFWGTLIAHIILN